MNTLYIVSTPIGNLEDITFRAVRILKEVSLILAEDTRHSRVLLEHYGIPTKMESYHDFNKEQVTPKYIEYLKKDGDIALVSDAGTPGIADPAFNLVRACKVEHIPVRAVPGANALLTALVASGFATDRFRFENFSPKKKRPKGTPAAKTEKRWKQHPYILRKPSQPSEIFRRNKKSLRRNKRSLNARTHKKIRRTPNRHPHRTLGTLQNPNPQRRIRFANRQGRK